MARDTREGKETGSLRIIGGEWRGRKLQFPAQPGLRPTGDRIRETLFNWLAPHVADARCLDLFAGSGALGLEALSRGAAWCDFVESGPGAAAALRHHLQTLGAGERAAVTAGDALAFLERSRPAYDIVFVDPPFGAGLVSAAAAALQRSTGILAEGALIYVEHGVNENPALPDTWRTHREKRAGGVVFRLLERSPV